jgi:hypothetical protein
MAKAPANRNMDSVRFAQRETRVNRCMAMGPFGKSHRDCLNRGASHAGFERPDREWLMRRDAPGGSVGLSGELHGAPPLRLGNVSLRRVKYACAAGERNMRGSRRKN